MGWLEAGLNDFQQKQDEDDEEDKAKAAAAVVAESRTHAITTEAEYQNQDDKKDEHYVLRDSNLNCMLSDAEFLPLVWGGWKFEFWTGLPGDREG
jgi:hypothetical protein